MLQYVLVNSRAHCLLDVIFMQKVPQSLMLPLTLLTGSHTQTQPPVSAVEIQRQPLADWLPSPSLVLSHTGHSGQEDALTPEVQGHLFYFLDVFSRPAWPLTS